MVLVEEEDKNGWSRVLIRRFELEVVSAGDYVSITAESIPGNGWIIGDVSPPDDQQVLVEYQHQPGIHVAVPLEAIRGPHTPPAGAPIGATFVTLPQQQITRAQSAPASLSQKFIDQLGRGSPAAGGKRRKKKTKRKRRRKRKKTKKRQEKKNKKKTQKKKEI